MLAALLSAILLPACGSTSAIEGTAVQICRTWEPIYPSRRDVLTDETARQIAGNNAANEKWCGERPAPSKQVAEARK